MRDYKSTGYKRRQYEDVARIIGERMRIAAALDTHLAREAHLTEIKNDFAELFASDNERFDRERFEARSAEYAIGKR